MRFLQTRKQPGFTLIEVLVALLIVSVGIGSVIQVTAKNVKNLSALEKRMVASWVASNHIADIRHNAKVNKIRNGSKAERYKMGGHAWRSKARIEKTEVERVFLLTVEVSDDSGLEKKMYASMTTALTDRL